MKETTCTIYDCEFDSYVKGVILGDKVYALDKEKNPIPAKEYVCEHVDYGMVQFYVGFHNRFESEEKETAQWGYLRLSSGEIVVPPIYDHASPFYGDRARVFKNGKYGFLNPYGKVVVDLIWDESENAFREGLCPVKRGLLWGYIDKMGQVIVEPRLEIANPFVRTQEGSAAALVKKEGKYGYLNNTGQYLFEPCFEDAREFWYKGYAPVMTRGIWAFINTQGEFVVPFQFEDVNCSYYYDTYYCVQKYGQWGILDEYLNVIMPEKGTHFVMYGNKKIYLRNGQVTSEREIKGSK